MQVWNCNMYIKLQVHKMFRLLSYSIVIALGSFSLPISASKTLPQQTTTLYLRVPRFLRVLSENYAQDQMKSGLHGGAVVIWDWRWIGIGFGPKLGHLWRVVLRMRVLVVVVLWVGVFVKTLSGLVVVIVLESISNRLVWSKIWIVPGVARSTLLVLPLDWHAVFTLGLLVG